MTQKQAIEAFKYWANQIYSPIGTFNSKADKMRMAYAKVIDSGEYAKLPTDVIEADEILFHREMRQRDSQFKT